MLVKRFLLLTHLNFRLPPTSSRSYATMSSVADPASPSCESKPGFQQLFEPESSTFTYLLWDVDSKDAIIVDPVDLTVGRDLELVQNLGLKLKYGINTHAHADHITGTWLLKQKVPGLQSAISTSSKAIADVHLAPGDKIVFGERYLTCRATPGHTAGCMSYIANDESFVLTGDALLIDGCGRTDFQGGSAETLYDSVHQQIFSLPNACIVYPAHDYKGHTSRKTKDQYVEIMANLDLAYPKKIDVAVPANMRCGAPDVE